MRTWRAALLLVLATLVLGGCTGQIAKKNVAQRQSASYDPIEKINRKVFWFNDHLDMYVLEPVARGWDRVLPDPVQHSIANFFQNARSPIVIINDLLQGKPRDSGRDVGRFAVNTTVGVLGFMDPATKWGLEQHNEDFGQTLGVWGILPGPFLMLPVLGPSNPRDGIGLIGDWAFSIYPFFVDQYVLLGARVIDTVNARSQLLAEIKNAKEASVDYYTFVRDAYFQRRQALVNDNAETGNEDLYFLEDESSPAKAPASESPANQPRGDEPAKE
jgi:phospholipid-binding lipoprotein MlaA